ncbi:MAG: NADH-quinone oxidoreductase subunit NuoN [Candidatus Puniceispirillaceae bacterium]
MTFSFESLYYALPEAILAVAGLIIVLVVAYGGDGSDNRKRVKNLTLLSYAIALAAIYLIGPQSQVILNGLFAVTPVTHFMKLLVLLGAMAATWMVEDKWGEGLERPEYNLLVLLATLGMLLMVSANDLMSLYMGLEMQSLPLYVIAAMRTKSVKSSEAGLKYFLLGALSSGMLLYGASFIYGYTGTTNFAEIAAAIDSTPSAGLVVGLVFLLSGLAFKISAAPFHMWTPDVYEGAPTPVTALFAIAPKVAAMTLILNVTYGAFGGIDFQWAQVVMALAVVSMLVGALGAIMQTNIKRMMAYSSIAHMGYALCGLAAGTAEGASGVMIYMTTYILMGAASFSIILLMRRDGAPVEKLSDLTGLSSTHPLLAAGLMIIMFSMAGIPPLAGFFGKWYVFLAAVNAGLVPLAVIGVLTSVIGAFYYLRIIRLMYFQDPELPLDKDLAFQNRAVLSACLVLIVLFVFLIGPVRDQASTAVMAVYAAGF